MPSVKELVGTHSLQSPLTQLRVGVESRRDDAVSAVYISLDSDLCAAKGRQADWV